MLFGIGEEGRADQHLEPGVVFSGLFLVAVLDSHDLSLGFFEAGAERIELSRFAVACGFAAVCIRHNEPSLVHSNRAVHRPGQCSPGSASGK
jgi:hypothetical protein